MRAEGVLPCAWNGLSWGQEDGSQSLAYLVRPIMGFDVAFACRLHRAMLRSTKYDQRRGCSATRSWLGLHILLPLVIGLEQPGQLNAQSQSFCVSIGDATAAGSLEYTSATALCRSGLQEYIAVGYVSEGGSSDGFICSMDTLLELEWARRLSITGKSFSFTDVITCADGGYAATGSIGDEGVPGSHDLLIARFDPAGDLQWLRAYGGGDEEIGVRLGETAAGELRLVGNTLSFGAGGRDIYVLAMDHDGNLLWTRTIGSPMDESGNGMVMDPSGAMVICSGLAQASSSDVLVVALNESGDVQWSKTYSESLAMGGVDIIAAPDSGYFVGGILDQGWFPDAYILRLGPSGTVQDAYRMDDGVGEYSGLRLAYTNANTLVVASSYLLYGRDATGLALWAKGFFDPGGTFQTELHDVLPLDDGGVLACGSVSHYGIQRSYARMIKARPVQGLGVTCCGVSPSTIPFDPQGPAVTLVPLASGAGGTLISTWTNVDIADHGTVTETCWLTSDIQDHGPLEMHVTAYPQPFADEVAIRCATPISSSASIRVIDAVGRVVFEEGPVHFKQGVMSLSVGHLPAGTYNALLNCGDMFGAVHLVKYGDGR